MKIAVISKAVSMNINLTFYFLIYLNTFYCSNTRHSDLGKEKEQRILKLSTEDIPTEGFVRWNDVYLMKYLELIRNPLMKTMKLL